MTCWELVLWGIVGAAGVLSLGLALREGRTVSEARVFDLVGRPLGLYLRQGIGNPLIAGVSGGGVVAVVEEVTSAEDRARTADLLWRIRDEARRRAALRRCA